MRVFYDFDFNLSTLHHKLIIESFIDYEKDKALDNFNSAALEILKQDKTKILKSHENFNHFPLICLYEYISNNRKRFNKFLKLYKMRLIIIKYDYQFDVKTSLNNINYITIDETTKSLILKIKEELENGKAD